MIAEKETAEFVSRQTIHAAKSITEVQIALLQLIIEYNRHKELQLKKGEVSLTELQKSLRNSPGETLSYCAVPNDVYRDLSQCGFLDNSGIHNYSVLEAANCDTVMILYNSKDQENMDQALKSMDAFLGSRALLDKDSFFLTSGMKDIYALEGLSEEDMEAFRAVCECHDPSSGSRPFTIPYTTIELDGTKLLLCRKSDRHQLEDNLQRAFSLAYSDGSEAFLKEVRKRLDLRKTRDFHVRNAGSGDLFADAAHPENRIEITTEEYSYFKNGKKLWDVPRSEESQLYRLYDTLENMDSPVVISKTVYEKVPGTNKSSYLRQNASAVLPHDRPVTVNVQEVLRQNTDPARTDPFMQRLSGYEVPSGGKDFQSLMKLISRTQKKRGKEKSVPQKSSVSEHKTEERSL